MNNFTYHNPVKIVFGKGTIAQLPELVPAGKKVLIVYGGGSIKKNSIYEQVMDALKGWDIAEFCGIEPNPLYETCMKGVDLAKDKGVEFLLAVGGGSVLDATKFIAAACRFDGEDPWEILRKDDDIVTGAIPLGSVMTLPATGSEMNMVAVISRASTKEKLGLMSPYVYPKFSILDPETTYSLPPKQLRNGIVDTFAHVVEQYVTYDTKSPLQDRQAEAILNTLVELTPRLMSDKKNYDDRASFMWCATQALNGLIGCGVAGDFASHLIGNELTSHFGLVHAEALAGLLPAIWKHQKANKLVKLAQFAERVWGVCEGDADQKADAAIEKTVEFFHSVGMPTRLSDFNIPAEGLEQIIDRIAERGPAYGEHQNIKAKEVEEIFEICK